MLFRPVGISALIGSSSLAQADQVPSEIRLFAATVLRFGNGARKRFGREPSRLRLRSGYTQQSLGAKIGVSKTHVSNLERGERAIAHEDLLAADEALDAQGRLIDLWDELTGSGRMAWLVEISRMIRESVAIYDFQSLVFPSYLQIEDYARALIRYGAPWLSADQMEEKVAARMDQARAVIDAGTPRVFCVVDETVLWRRYESVDITRAQLAHVVSLVEQGRVSMQIIPAQSKRHPGNSGAFTVLTGPQSPDVVFAESVHEGQTITAHDDVAGYRMLYGSLQAEAAPTGETLRMLRDEMRKLENDHE
ncbi:helix-turn-helix domain-containing protein [Marinactinospora rubrisoli]|uniref:Helix-turn-helix domain-containing protein n=1 Tax=Marinactinospora rubrisoli TaxID=2715399 RepID=A0ABW2KAW5_9ACTN